MFAIGMGRPFCISMTCLSVSFHVRTQSSYRRDTSRTPKRDLPEAVRSPLQIYAALAIGCGISETELLALPAPIKTNKWKLTIAKPGNIAFLDAIALMQVPTLAVRT